MHDLQAYTVCGAEGEFNIFVTNGHPEDIVVSAASNNFELNISKFILLTNGHRVKDLFISVSPQFGLKIYF